MNQTGCFIPLWVPLQIAYQMDSFSIPGGHPKEHTEGHTEGHTERHTEGHKGDGSRRKKKFHIINLSVLSNGTKCTL